MKIRKLFLVALLILSQKSLAQAEQFHAGKVISEFGRIATVEGMVPLPKNAAFKVSFDVATQAKVGEINRSLDSVARFINMHAASGVPVSQLNLAVVIHGGATKDMTTDEYYTSKHEAKNHNQALIKALQEQGVSFSVCGQSAAFHGVKKKDLLPGVELSLSAMTAHALLQQQGYTLNPF